MKSGGDRSALWREALNKRKTDCVVSYKQRIGEGLMVGKIYFCECVCSL